MFHSCTQIIAPNTRDNTASVSAKADQFYLYSCNQMQNQGQELKEVLPGRLFSQRFQQTTDSQQRAPNNLTSKMSSRSKLRLESEGL
jgi:hypothetical protein